MSARRRWKARGGRLENGEDPSAMSAADTEARTGAFGIEAAYEAEVSQRSA
jgi:hypothetical protein